MSFSVVGLSVTSVVLAADSKAESWRAILESSLVCVVRSQTVGHVYSVRSRTVGRTCVRVRVHESACIVCARAHARVAFNDCRHKRALNDGTDPFHGSTTERQTRRHVSV